MKQYKCAEFKSGFSVSIQASKTNYSTPRDNTGPYTHVELGFPSGTEPLIIGFADDPDDPTGTVYGYVPAGIVQAMLVKHGGLESGEIPPLHMTPEQAAIMAESLL